MSAIEQSHLLKVFPDAKRSGSNGWYMASCPAHNDNKPSLAVIDAPNEPYGLHWECKALCTNEAVEAALSEQGRLPERSANGNGNHQPQKKREVDWYDYTDENGAFLFQTVRYEPKDFKQRTRGTHNEWIWTIKNLPKVLFHLPAVMKADEIVLVEGEKDALTADRLGFVGTTAPCGAKAAWLDAYTKALHGKNVTIIADIDQNFAGQIRGQVVAKALHGKVASFRVIEMPNRPEGVWKWDLTKWVEAGGTSEQLRKLIDDAPQWTPNSTPQSFPVESVSLKEYLEKTEEKRPYIVEDLFYQGISHQFMGTIKAGKTTFLLRCVKAILSGDDFLGKATNPANVLYVTEQPKASFESQLLESGIYSDDNVRELYIIDVAMLGIMDWPTRAQFIRDEAKRRDCGLVVIDTFVKIALVNDIANAGEMNRVMEAITPLVNIDGRALTLGWHERKSGGRIVEAAAGTAAGGGTVDLIYRLQTPGGESEKTRKRTLESIGRLPAMGSDEAVVIELSEELHGEYRVIGDRVSAKRATNEQRVLDVVPEQEPGIGKFEIVSRINQDAKKRNYVAPSKTTIGRTIDRLVAQGPLVKSPTEDRAGNERRPHGLYYASNVPF
jgi:hypothetical protein